jgi:hypothetical protein
MGYYLSAAWYRRGVLALTGVSPAYVFLAQEVETPYLCSLVGVNPAIIDAADAAIERGLATWRRCVETNTWPAYPTRVCYPDAPAYMLAQWEEQQVADIEANGLGNGGADLAYLDRPLAL